MISQLGFVVCIGFSMAQRIGKLFQAEGETCIKDQSVGNACHSQDTAKQFSMFMEVFSNCVCLKLLNRRRGSR